MMGEGRSTASTASSTGVSIELCGPYRSLTPLIHFHCMRGVNGEGYCYCFHL